MSIWNSLIWMLIVAFPLDVDWCDLFLSFFFLAFSPQMSSSILFRSYTSLFLFFFCNVFQSCLIVYSSAQREIDVYGEKVRGKKKVNGAYWSTCIGNATINIRTKLFQFFVFMSNCLKASRRQVVFSYMYNLMASSSLLGHDVYAVIYH